MGNAFHLDNGDDELIEFVQNTTERLNAIEINVHNFAVEINKFSNRLTTIELNQRIANNKIQHNYSYINTQAADLTHKVNSVYVAASTPTTPALAPTPQESTADLIAKSKIKAPKKKLLTSMF
jgi:isochorismate synthase EntC